MQLRQLARCVKDRHTDRPLGFELAVRTETLQITLQKLFHDLKCESVGTGLDFSARNICTGTPV